jgi:hypothetical protein
LTSGSPRRKQAEIHDWVARNRHRQIDETISALRYARNQASHLLAHVIGSAAQEKTAYEIEHPDGSRETFEITMTSSSIVHPSHDRTTRATYQFPHLDGEGEQNPCEMPTMSSG